MLGTFYNSLNGIITHSRAMNVVGNNLSNINTVGFKRSELEFEQLISGAVSGRAGNGNPIQFGLGAVTGDIGNFFAQGAVQGTGNATNIALVGDGFFMTSDGTDTYYTRAGNFNLNTLGQLVAPNGTIVQGYLPGAIGESIPAGGTPTNITVDYNSPAPASATSLIRMVTNLSGEMEPGETFSTQTEIFDSNGNSHTMTVNFTKSEVDGSFTYDVSLDGSPVEGQGGTLTFGPDGTLASVNGTPVDGTFTNPTITIPGAGLQPAADDLTMTWDLVDTDGDGQSFLTNYGDQSSSASLFQNGYPTGTLEQVAFQQDGTLMGFYSNGKSFPIAQVAIAEFNNNHGLKQIDGNMFMATGASGEANLVTGANGPTVQGASLETSNVDIATEFTNLITVQRGYQGNTKGITTADQVLQEILNLKR